MKVNEIANLLGASLVVPEGMSAEVEILKLAPINQAAEGDLTFLSNPDYAKFLSETKKFLQQNNFNVNTKLFKNCEHNIPTEGVKLGLEFLKKNM